MSPETHARQAVAGARVVCGALLLLSALVGDAIGAIIPVVISDYRLSLQAAGTLQYVPAAAVAVGLLLLLFMVDRAGARRTVLWGLAMFAFGGLLVPLFAPFTLMVAAMVCCALGIAAFKLGVYALVGELAHGEREHARLMNMLEACFAVGAIGGPLLVLALVNSDQPWQWLYAMTALWALVLWWFAARRLPRGHLAQRDLHLAATVQVLRAGRAWWFAALLAIYVVVEMSVVVWLPSFLRQRGAGLAVAAFALTLFLILRAAGRMASYWLLASIRWELLLALSGLLLCLCMFAGALGSLSLSLIVLPLAGLFMAPMFPTLNSRALSSFPRQQQGAVAGLIMLCASSAAALGSFGLAVISDALGDLRYGLLAAAGLAVLLAIGLLLNLRPIRAR